MRRACPLQPGCAQISVHRNEIVQLAASDSIMGPFPVRDLGFNPPEPPAGLFLNFPRHGLPWRLAGLDMTTHHVPGAGQQSTAGRAAVHIDTVSAIANEGPHAADLTYAATLLKPT